MDDGKKIKINLLFSLMSQLLTIALGMLIPRLVLLSYGSEVNGLLESVTQIYSYIGLFEAGVGTATVQALYKLLGEKNNRSINSVLAATNRYYHKTGLFYFIAIVIFSVIYPLVVKTSIKTETIILIIILNGLEGVIRFLFYGKYFLLLQAEGKSYVQIILTMITNIGKNVTKIFLLTLGFDVVSVQAVAVVISIVQMIYMKYYIKKNYAWIDLNVEPDYNSISQSKNVLVHQIAGVVFNNTDMIVLTLFCDLKIVSIYSMYLMFFNIINTVQGMVSSCVNFKLGQLFHIDRKRFVEYMDCYELYYITFVFALYSITYYFIIPVIKLYTNGISDASYIDTWLPILFVVIQLLLCGRSSSNKTISFAGHFKQTQNRAIIEMIINLVVSLVFVNIIGVYGVLIGTIAALLYRVNDMILYSNHVILERSAKNIYRRWAINVVLFALVIFLEKNFIIFDLASYKDILFAFVPITLLNFLVFMAGVSIIERKCFSTLIRVVRKMI